MTILENAPTGLAEEQKVAVRSVYQEVAAEYDERIPGSGPTDEGFTQAERDFVLSKVRAGQKVLDMGCGTGRFTVPMAEAGVQVTGLDISRAMLDVTEAKLSARGLSGDLYEGDMAHLPFEDNSFDVVTSMLALMHIPLEDREAVFAEVARVLRPGGRLVIGVKNGLFEQFFKGDRFAAVDITDVEAKQLLFTKTRGGKDLTAPWYSFTPQDLNALCAASGMTVTHLRGNSTISAWLADEVLQDNGVAGVVRALEKNLGDVPPFNHLGYHILVEAVKPRR
ncbi:methyltransferase domain-containing protein [Streptomyces apocyni]|uniref:methyltransferase domain-containing protein n=1 Tax=Streptomyces apocyni TaxID=2654677 RepID=UPI0012EABE02|nr:methyltransferase domain-containing protein [Streptomyces apocyni]